MRRSRRFRRPGSLRDLIIAGGLIFIVALIAARVGDLNSERVTGAARVVDGDSLEIGSRRIRLAGIDAPELDQTCSRGEAGYPCGAEARSHLSALIAGPEVACLILGRDKYRRDLATCTAGNVDLNAAMVRSGHAVAFGAYGDEEASAAAERAGLWSGEFETPANWRRSRNDPEETVHAGLTGLRAFLRRLLGV